MKYPISVYTLENDTREDYNVIAFFSNSMSEKLYTIIESSNPNDQNTVAPFIVNRMVEQELELVTDDLDKDIVSEYCKINLEDRIIDFSYSKNLLFRASLDLDALEIIEACQGNPIQEMLDQKESLDIDNLIRHIDEQIIELSLSELNENNPESTTDFFENCINVKKYDLWLNEKIEAAKDKISNFKTSNNFLQVLNLLKAFQTLITLISETNKEIQRLEDILVDLIRFSDKDLDLNKILVNESIQAFLSEHETKSLYRTVVLRTKDRFSPRVVNEVANYFYKEKIYNKAVELFNSLPKRYNSTSEDINLVETYNSIGCCYIGMLRFDDAYKAFKQAIKLDSSYAAAYNNWAYSLAVECDFLPKGTLRDEKLNEALRHINRAIQHKNDEVSFYSNKACIEYELKSFFAVIEDYNDATNVSHNYEALETILTLKIYSQVELYCTKKRSLEFTDLLDDLETIYKNSVGSDKYLFQALKVYHNIKNQMANVNEICLNLLVFEFIVNKLISTLAIKGLEQHIYFYTNLSNLQMLLEDDSFRQPIFCVNHMNDPNEGQELYKTLLQQIDKKELIQDVFKKTKNANAQTQRQEICVEFTFLKAFTENDDSLPMWIHYGDQGKGCCIKVTPHFFYNFENTSDTEDRSLGKKPFDDQYRLYKVLYIKDGRLLNNTDSETVKLYDDFVTSFSELCSKYLGYTDQLKSIVSESVQKIISSIIYLFKNTDYQYEKEMRIILQRSVSDLERKDIDIQLTKPTKDNPIPRTFIYTKKPLIIDEIILGPKLNDIDNLIPYITMRLLKMHDYQEENIHITKSLIEYR